MPLDTTNMPLGLEEIPWTGDVLRPWLRYDENHLIERKEASKSGDNLVPEPTTYIDMFLRHLEGKDLLKADRWTWNENSTHSEYAQREWKQTHATDGSKHEHNC
jgi:hypothetical protein